MTIKSTLLRMDSQGKNYLVTRPDLARFPAAIGLAYERIGKYAGEGNEKSGYEVCVGWQKEIAPGGG